MGFYSERTGVLIKRVREAFTEEGPCEHTVEKAAACQPGRKFLQETSPDSILILDFQPLELGEN